MSQETSRPAEPLITKAFVKLWIFSFVTFFSAFQLFPVIPFRILELGRTKAEAGLFLTLYTYACALSAPITGAIADTVGRKRVLTLGASFFVLFSVLYGFIPQFSWLLAVAATHGLFWSSLLASSGAMLSEAIPASRRTEGLAYWGLASTFAASFGPAVGLFVHRHFGWTILCLEMAALSTLMAFMASRLAEGEAHQEKRSFPPLSELVDWRVMVAASAFLTVSFGYGGLTSYVVLLANARKITPASLFFTVFAAAILVTRLLFARLGDRLGPKAILFPSLAILPPAFFLLAFSHDRALFVVAAFVMGTGFGGAYPAFSSFALSRTPPQRRAATMGSVLWAFDTGVGTGSLITGMLVEKFGFRFAFSTAGFLALAGLPLFILSSRVLPKRHDPSLPIEA